jgi:hypothetical protein
VEGSNDLKLAYCITDVQKHRLLMINRLRMRLLQKEV